MRDRGSVAAARSVVEGEMRRHKRQRPWWDGLYYDVQRNTRTAGRMALPPQRARMIAYIRARCDVTTGGTEMKGRYIATMVIVMAIAGTVPDSGGRAW